MANILNATDPLTFVLAEEVEDAGLVVPKCMWWYVSYQPVLVI
jgi:hypothetical protein